MGASRLSLLLLFAHPAFERSRANRALVDAARGIEGVTFHDLYETYPEFDVDVAREQELLLAHDVVVLQHPLYWYSAPALVKQWVDLVLEHGWAYGEGGDALRGKTWVHAFTSGGGAEAYGPTGHNRYTLREFLRPFEQTAALCGMRFLPPFTVQGVLDAGERALAARAREYAATLYALRDGAFDLDGLAATGAARLPSPFEDDAEPR